MQEVFQPDRRESDRPSAYDVSVGRTLSRHASWRFIRPRARWRSRHARQQRCHPPMDRRGIAIVVLLVIVFGSSLVSHSNATAISWSRFKSDISHHTIKSVNVDNSNGTIIGTLKSGQNYFRRPDRSRFLIQEIGSIGASGRDAQVLNAEFESLVRHPHLRRCIPLVHRDSRAREPPSSRSDVRNHVDRALAGEGLFDRAASHDIQRCRWLQRREARN